MLKKIVLLFCTLCISSCASYYTGKGEKDYLQSRNGQRLIVPPPLTDDDLSGFYVLPSQDNNPEVSIKPPQ